jgi:hypothetical protein
VFRIKVEIRAYYRSGLKALDFRRVRGLPDSADVRITGESSTSTRWVDVPETFARKHADNFVDTTDVYAIITAEQTVKGDLVPAGGDHLELNPDLSDQRIMELWEMGE